MRNRFVQTVVILLLPFIISPILFAQSIVRVSYTVSSQYNPKIVSHDIQYRGEFNTTKIYTDVVFKLALNDSLQNSNNSLSIQKNIPLVVKSRQGEAIDTTIIHALRNGKWSRKDNDIFMKYILSLDKEDRIKIFTQLNTKKKQINIKKKYKKSAAIDSSISQAQRHGRWSRKDNRVFLKYISRLNKKDRIEMLKELNIAVNYQQMNIGTFNDPSINPIKNK